MAKLSIKPLSQKDSRWGSKKLPGGHTVAQSGCLVICLSMQFDTTPNELLGKDLFNGNLISWDKAKKYFNADFQWVKQGDYKQMIRERADQGLPTIIRIANFEHFILAIGYDDNSKAIFVNDPLKGETYYLNATDYEISSLRLLTPKDHQPPETDDALAECLKQHKDLMDQLSVKQTEIDNLRKRLNTSEVTRKEIGAQLKEFHQENEEFRETVGELQSKLKTANSKITKLKEENENLVDERNKNKNYYEKALNYDIRKYEPARALVAGLMRALGREPIARKENIND